MTASTLIGLGIAALAAGAGWAAFWLASRARRLDMATASKAVDAAAYDRARELYESVIEQVRGESDRLKDEVTRLHDEVNTLQSSNAELRTEVRGLRTEVGKLRTDNRHLAEELAAYTANGGGNGHA